MNITDDFFSEIKKIKNDENLLKKIDWQTKEIDENKKKIQNYESEITKGHKKEFDLIKQIRDLNSDENNHEDSLICNELIKSKKTEYKDLYDKLYKNLEQNYKLEMDNRKKIIDRINKIEKAKEEIQNLIYAKDGGVAKEMEKTRYKVLIKYGNYLYDKENNKKLIDIINEQINNEKYN